MRGSEHTQVPAFYKGQIVTNRGAEEIRRFISVNDQCVPGFHSSKQVSSAEIRRNFVPSFQWCNKSVRNTKYVIHTTMCREPLHPVYTRQICR